MTGEAQGTTVQPPGSGQRWWRCRYCGDGRTFVGTVEQEAREATSHEASCPQRPAAPQPWVCPTPEPGLFDVVWSAGEVKPGTPYDDEPSETVPPGWYVHGRPRDLEYFEPSPIVIRVEQAIDQHGCDRTEFIAGRLVDALGRETDAERRRIHGGDSTFVRSFASGARMALAQARAKGWLR